MPGDALQLEKAVKTSFGMAATSRDLVDPDDAESELCSPNESQSSTTSKRKPHDLISGDGLQLEKPVETSFGPVATPMELELSDESDLFSEEFFDFVPEIEAVKNLGHRLKIDGKNSAQTPVLTDFSEQAAWIRCCYTTMDSRALYVCACLCVRNRFIWFARAGWVICGFRCAGVYSLCVLTYASSSSRGYFPCLPPFSRCVLVRYRVVHDCVSTPTDQFPCTFDGCLSMFVSLAERQKHEHATHWRPFCERCHLLVDVGVTPAHFVVLSSFTLLNTIGVATRRVSGVCVVHCFWLLLKASEVCCIVIHNREYHSNIRPYKCQVCCQASDHKKHKRFNTRGALMLHREFCGGPPGGQCQICMARVKGAVYFAYGLEGASFELDISFCLLMSVDTARVAYRSYNNHLKNKHIPVYTRMTTEAKDIDIAGVVDEMVTEMVTKVADRSYNNHLKNKHRPVYTPMTTEARDANIAGEVHEMVTEEIATARQEYEKDEAWFTLRKIMKRVAHTEDQVRIVLERSLLDGVMDEVDPDWRHRDERRKKRRRLKRRLKKRNRMKSDVAAATETPQISVECSMDTPFSCSRVKFVWFRRVWFVTELYVIRCDQLIMLCPFPVFVVYVCVCMCVCMG